MRGQIQVNQIGGNPPLSWVVRARREDKLGVGIDAGDVMPAPPTRP
jgi:hypothetical protein